MPETPELHKDIQAIKYEIDTQNQLIKTLLSLQKDELLQQKISLFIGRTGPKVTLIKLYLAIGTGGKTRRELEDLGFKPGTICPYCAKLMNGAVLRVKETRPDGQDVLGYTVVEELAQLSLHLKTLLETVAV